MWRKTVCAVGGLVVACAAAYSLTSFSTASAVSFDLRWLYTDPAGVKEDRLTVGQMQETGNVVYAFQLPDRNLTVVAKGPSQRRVQQGAVEVPRSLMRSTPANPVRDVIEPSERKQSKESLLDGCEPSFSPVTMPSLSHVSGRCVS